MYIYAPNTSLYLHGFVQITKYQYEYKAKQTSTQSKQIAITTTMATTTTLLKSAATPTKECVSYSPFN